MAFLHQQYQRFVEGATCTVSTPPEKVEEAGTSLWELVVCPEQRKLLTCEQPLSDVAVQMRVVLQLFVTEPYPDGKLGTWRARWAQIAMGVITNFVADGQPAARIVKETVLAVMDSAHEREGLLTFHAPFTTECAQCIRILYHREQRTVSESTEEDPVATYLCTRMETWLQLTMSGNSTLTLEILRLMHSAIESSPQVHHAALEAAVLPALLDLLTALTEGSMGMHVDSTVTTAACDLLDLVLMVARISNSASANDSPGTAQQVEVIVELGLAAQLAQQLVAVLEQSELTAVSAAAITCLYRMAAMEENPVPNVSQQLYHPNYESTGGCFETQLLVNTSVGSNRQSHSPHTCRHAEQGHLSQQRTTVKADEKHPDGVEPCSTSEAQGCCLWHLAHSGGAVEGAVVVAATLTSDGPSGSFWPHTVSVLAVLSWVGAALVQAADAHCNRRAAVHKDGDSAVEEGQRAKRAKHTMTATSDCIQEVSRRFSAKVHRLQDDIVLGLSEASARDGVQYVLQCSDYLRRQHILNIESGSPAESSAIHDSDTTFLHPLATQTPRVSDYITAAPVAVREVCSV